jgi:hypothetical protein
MQIVFRLFESLNQTCLEKSKQSQTLINAPEHPYTALVPVEKLTRARIIEALNLLGQLAAEENLTLELCIYGRHQGRGRDRQTQRQRATFGEYCC